MSRSRSWIPALAFLMLAGTVFAQGNPTGTITGKVMDPDNLMLPGVTVTAESPVLQGARTAVSSANGDYIIPFLPAGDYTVTFELSGFATLKQTISLKMADTLPVNVKLSVAAVSETVTVSDELAQYSEVIYVSDSATDEIVTPSVVDIDINVSDSVVVTDTLQPIYKWAIGDALAVNVSEAVTATDNLPEYYTECVWVSETVTVGTPQGDG